MAQALQYSLFTLHSSLKKAKPRISGALLNLRVLLQFRLGDFLHELIHV